MRYRVRLKGRAVPEFMASLDGLVHSATHRLYWTLGHTVEDVIEKLHVLEAEWAVTAHSQCPAGRDVLYAGAEPNTEVINYTLGGNV